MFLRGLITRRLRDFERDTTEIIERTICKKIWFIIFAYRPLNNNKYIFFSELSNSLNCAAMRYDYVRYR